MNQIQQDQILQEDVEQEDVLLVGEWRGGKGLDVGGKEQGCTGGHIQNHYHGLHDGDTLAHGEKAHGKVQSGDMGLVHDREPENGMELPHGIMAHDGMDLDDMEQICGYMAHDMVRVVDGKEHVHA